MQRKKGLIKIFWEHLARYRLLAAIGFTSNIGSYALDIIAPIYLKMFFDVLSGDARRPDIISAAGSVIFIILIIRIGRWLARRIADFSSNKFQPLIMSDLEQTALHHLLGHSHQFFSDTFSGSLVRRISRFSRSFEDIYYIAQDNILRIVFLTAGSLFVLWTRDYRLALALGAGCLLFVAANLFVARWKIKFDKDKAEKDTKNSAQLSDTISNAINIKIFSGQAYEESLFAKVNGDFRKALTKSWNIGSLSAAIQSAVAVLLEIGTLYVAVRLYAEGKITLGDFVLLQTYILTLLEQLWGLDWVVRRIYEARADAQEMVDILNTPHAIQDAKSTKPLRVHKGKVELKNVSFWYQKNRPILKGLNMVIKPHEKVALVGASGAGKSTIIKALFRFYDIQRGKILIDGQDISKTTQDELRNAIALVPQEPILFHRTLMDNIRYGKREATDKEVIEAAKKAHCHEFISSLPEGYQSFVGERGIKLSGGERQRVAIARAILKNAPILVLDEATSSLDSESESLIQDALHALMQDKTVIVIAHRLSTIREMDRIIVLEQGRVLDTGTHDELLKANDLYRKLWTIQAGGFLPEV